MPKFRRKGDADAPNLKLPEVDQEETNQIDVVASESNDEIIDIIGHISELSDIDQIRKSIRILCDKLSSDLRLQKQKPEDTEIQYILDELKQAHDSHTHTRAKYYLSRLVKSLSKVRTSKVNDINLYRWKQYPNIITDSLWVLDKRDSSGVHTAGYWGNFVPQIPNQLIQRFTKAGEWVLDTFAGSGTTLIESQRLGRNCLGVELQSSIAQTAQELVAKELNPHNVTCEIVVGDSTNLDIRSELERHGSKQASLIIMHPPYHDIIKFSDDPRDMSNAADLDTFLDLIGKVVQNVKDLLPKDRYLALVIGDKFSKGEYIPLGFLTSQVITSNGFKMKSIIVKNFEETAGKRTQRELWRYRALAGGYYVFKHEYIFLFTKNEEL